MILKLEVAMLIGPNNGTVVLYRFGGLSDVGRSRRSSCASNCTVAFSFSIFLRKKEAITVVGVW